MAGKWTHLRKILDSNKEVKICDASDNIGVYKLFITEDIPYPLKYGRVIYIGKSETKSMYKRIEEHLKTESNQGLCNYITLDDVKISFRITKIKKQVKLWEAKEIQEHLDEFGAYPVCNRKKGSTTHKGKRIIIGRRCRKCGYVKTRRKDGKCPCSY